MSDSVEIKIQNIVVVPIGDLVENPKNRNSHPKKQIKRLAELIKYNGFRQPITVSNRTGYIVAGHGRLLAARELGLTEVPVSFQDFDTEDHEVAYGVSDNAIAEWAYLDFKGINQDLANFDPSFELNMLGIDGFKLDVAEKKVKEPGDDTRAQKTMPGDLWQVGDHQLVVGDTNLHLADAMLRRFEELSGGIIAELRSRNGENV